MRKITLKEGDCMQKYVDRLICCGYDPERAYSVCCDMVRNLSLVDLVFFITVMEERYV